MHDFNFIRLTDDIKLKLFVLVFVSRQVKLDHIKRIASDRFIVTIGTSNFSEVLSIENIYNKRFVSFEKICPLNISKFLNVLIFVVFGFNVRLDENFIRFIHQSIHKKGQKFLRILLGISRKSFAYTFNSFFYARRCYGIGLHLKPQNFQ